MTILKPETCSGCPLYGDGRGFVPGIYPDGAKVALIGGGVGDAEERHGEPFVGTAGAELQRTFLPLAGLDLAGMARDNVIRCRWQEPGKKSKGNKLPTGVLLDKALAHCQIHDRNLSNFDLVIALGPVALHKLTPKHKAFEWRGHLISEEGI